MGPGRPGFGVRAGPKVRSWEKRARSERAGARARSGGTKGLGLGGSGGCPTQRGEWASGHRRGAGPE